MNELTYPKELKSLGHLVIDGERVPSLSGASIAVLDPATGGTVAQVPGGEADDIDRAVGAARSALKGPWRALDPTERGRVLMTFAALIRRDVEVLTRIECLDVGKPLSQARRDVLRAAAYIEFYAGMADKLNGESVPLGDGKTAFTLLEPVGVTGHILPWNYPISTLARGLGPALACGNTVVAKPAEQTPLTSIMLGVLFTEAGGPNGVFNVVTGYGETAGAALAEHPDIAHLTFTGSTETGRSVMRAAAGPLAGVTLELGGKSPIVVMDDADLDAAAAGVARGIFFNAGQICTAGSRLIVGRPVYNQLVSKVVERAEALAIGHGFDDPDLGPLVSAEQLRRVSAYVERASKAGMSVLTGGERVFPESLEGGTFYGPTVLIDVPVDAEIAQDEVFGPVLCVHVVDDFDEAVAVANATRYGLVAGIYTKDVSRAMRFARKAEAGQIFVNGYLAAGDTVPFGGMKESGIGREKGVAALMNYCEIKAVTISH